MKGKAAVFTGVGKPIEMWELDVPEAGPGAAIVRIDMCTVCGSDVHTWLGHRHGDTPGILGHETMGRIVALGEGLTHDILGRPLSIGDRVTYAMYASCGDCYYCRVAGLPQKCVKLHKYGHGRCDVFPYWTGGFAEYLYLAPGTVIIKVPDDMKDEEITPINCATSTVASGLDTIGVQPAETAVVQGLGMLGVTACAMLKDRGAGRVIAMDVDPVRLELARRFGADETVRITGQSPEELGELIRAQTDGRGANLVVEVSGNARVVPAAVEMLAIGGRFLTLGLVSPGADAQIDWWKVVFKCLTIRGVHNFAPRHLVQALDFVYRTRSRFPHAELVTHKLSLPETEKALELCRDRVALRAAVVPS